MKSPLSIVNEKFGDKAKLVSELESFSNNEELWLARTSKSKGLAHVSNAKLLRLHRTFTEVKEKFGTRAKLIDAIADLEKRTKDDGYKQRLEGFPVPRLYDLFQSATKRTQPKEKPAKKAAPAPKKAAAAKKTAAPKKAAAAKKKTSAKSSKK